MTTPPVRLEGEHPSGLSELVAGLLEQQLAGHPRRADRLVPMVVTLAVPDADVVTTVRADGSGISVADGGARDAHLRIVGDAGRLLALTGAPLRAGLPDPFRHAGREALGDVLTGRVRVRGIVRHPVRLARFMRLLSVHERAGERSDR